MKLCANCHLILLQPLWWYCVDCVIHHKRDVREEYHHYYVCSANKLNNRVISSGDLYVACCHGVKLCAHAAWDFRSQQYKVRLTLPTTHSYDHIMVAAMLMT